MLKKKLPLVSTSLFLQSQRMGRPRGLLADTGIDSRPNAAKSAVGSARPAVRLPTAGNVRRQHRTAGRCACGIGMLATFSAGERAGLSPFRTPANRRERRSSSHHSRLCTKSKPESKNATAGRFVNRGNFIPSIKAVPRGSLLRRS